MSNSRKSPFASRRAWSRGFRWAGLGAAAVLAAAVLTVAPSAIVSAVPSAKADNCPDIAVTTFGNPADRSGGTIAAQSAMFGAKAVDYCNPEDPICHAGQGNEWKGHTDGYVPVYTSQAASFVATRLLSVLPQTGPEGPMGVTPGYGPLGPLPGQLPGQGPLPGQLPGQGPLPGPDPNVPGPTVVSQTQPAAFH